MSRKSYPVFYTYEDQVKGNGFIAEVFLHGTALMVHDEDDEWWMYGVQPGILVEGGETFNEARLLFRQSFRELLIDIAKGAADFEAFHAEAMPIFEAVNEPMSVRWAEAVNLIRSEQAEIEPQLKNLPRADAAAGARFEIRRLSADAATDDNPPDEFGLATAA